MRKRTAKSSQALVERARELGVRLPDYAVPSAQADLQITSDARKAAAEIVRVLTERDKEDESRGAEAEPDTPAAAQPTGSGRSKADPRRVVLNI
jgi:hypothetical protein